MNINAGTVYLVGAGPGDPGLITVRGLSLLRQADVIVHDRLVARELIDEVRPGAEVIDVGKTPGAHRYAQSWINALIVDRAQAGFDVLRLKGGDPFVFGRGFEELEACRRGGVECIVVPGVSSAIAAPAAAGIPVTQRGEVRSFAVVTGRVAPDAPGPELDYRALASMDTLVILMGRSNLPELAAGLLGAGRDPSTPVACVEKGTMREQRVVTATLATVVSVAERASLGAPMVFVIGSVAKHATANAINEMALAESNHRTKFQVG